ncbi:MAG TPA: NADH-dependent [FeFe] hydrogenase, group A6 [Vicinamibacterales bacterium]|nr:NADH-dependent [FeFe] hydrogenase, group A6 [Vicinamibacterales bacterium]HPK72003.1 NADH-dependent [FeFe] hydrogenase, group A6 [Vicinamibacterales bacterium]HPW19759.1 NADH-dependent [FeFe] hydrogenase, group A6 [Vicinamibacterales bacterium]
MMTLEINGRSVDVHAGDTVLAAARRAGIRIPTLCHYEGLPPSGACRMCVVEIEGQRGLVPSCAFPASDGLKVQTHSPRAVDARRTLVELLLANHPDDCLYCARNGECQLQELAEQLGVRRRRYFGGRTPGRLDIASPSIARDPSKCILCGKCVRVCEEVQSVGAIDFIGRGSKTRIGTAFDEGLNVSSCVNCGQCVAVCPVGALVETRAIDDVRAALADPSRIVVVQHAPSVSVSLAEEFGLKPGTDVDGPLVTALRRLGFAWVFDTSFSADLTIMEEASELAHRLTTGGVLPMMTSCSAGWVKFMEQFYPDLLPNLSTCKSPQQMLGAIVKTFLAERLGLDPARIYSVAIMPCTAKKFEAGREEMGRAGQQDIDAVLTTRELAELIRMYGLDLSALPPDAADTPFGERTSAGKLFGASGGVAEAAVRTAHYLLTGQSMEAPKIQALRGLDGIKEYRTTVGGLDIGVAAVSGLGNARRLLDQVRAGRRDLHLIEVMACPGGCIAGGGQPRSASTEAIRARMQALYLIDRDATVRASHENPAVKRLYAEFLEKPLSHRSHELLHTHYERRQPVM